MKTFVVLAAVALLAGCASSTKVGGMAYCPHGQACTFTVTPPAAAASAPAK